MHSILLILNDDTSFALGPSLNLKALLGYLHPGFDYRGLTFEKVFWLREPTEELGVQVELCLRPNTKYPGGPNMLVPGIYDKIDEIELKLSAKRILRSFREGEE